MNSSAVAIGQSVRTSRRRRALLAVAAVFAATLAAAPVAGAVSLSADYRFDDNLDSSIPGAPALATEGPGIQLFETKTVNGVGDRVLSFPAGTGLRLEPTPSLNRGDYSVIVTFAWDALSGYQRILAFDPVATGTDDGLYSYDDYLDFYYYDNASTDYEGPPGALTASQFFDLTFTRATDKTTKAYVGDAEQISFSDAFDEALIRGDGLRFFKDDAGEDEAGSVARIRIYDGVLTSREIATIRATGGLAATGAAMGKPRLVPKPARKAKKVDAAVTVFCPSEGVSCPVTGAIMSAKKRKGMPAILGTFTSDLGAGRAASPKIKLSRKGRKAVKRKGKIRIKTEVEITPGSGKTLVVKNGGKV